MRNHFRTSTEYLSPVHVVWYVQAKRTKDTMSPEVPQDCGDHRWTKDGSCAKCLTVMTDNAAHEWQAPGWGDGIPADKPERFDEMVAAAQEATRQMMEQGYGRGDDATKDAAWHAADAARRAVT